MNSHMNSKFGQIGSCIEQLPSIERLEKYPYTYNWKNVASLGLHIYEIFFILAGYKDMHKSLDEFEFRPDPAIDYGVVCT